MAVAARTVNSLTEAANAPQQPAPGVRAGTYYLEVGDDEIVDGWHTHEFHQLEYAVEGVVAVETTTARYLVPPRQALWIPAGVEHCSTLTRLKAVSIFFDPSVDLPAGDCVRIVSATPLLREMIRYTATVASEPHRSGPIGRCLLRSPRASRRRVVQRRDAALPPDDTRPARRSRDRVHRRASRRRHPRRALQRGRDIGAIAATPRSSTPPA